MSALDRLLAKIEISNGCWEWQASKDYHGYERFYFNGKPRRAHRAAYELLVEPVEANLELDHLCRNRACVNPDHLEPVTRLVNARRGSMTNRALCRNGLHPWPESAGRMLSGPRAGRAYCLACKAEQMRRFRGTAKEERAAS